MTDIVPKQMEPEEESRRQHDGTIGIRPAKTPPPRLLRTRSWQRERSPPNANTSKIKVLRRSVEYGQYLSAEFTRAAAKLGILHSAGRAGTSFANAWAESFNATLKNGRVHRVRYPTRDHALSDITAYIELCYNQIRLHSAID